MSVSDFIKISAASTCQHAQRMGAGLKRELEEHSLGIIAFGCFLLAMPDAWNGTKRFIDGWDQYLRASHYAQHEINDALRQPIPSQVISLERENGDRIAYRIQCFLQDSAKSKDDPTNWRATAVQIAFGSQGEMVEMPGRYYRDQSSVKAPACASAIKLNRRLMKDAQP